ncbi:uroporphyrinogen decarboxylase-like [Photinus pyralis]|uniref:uroporphyrinogen decarboxylase-like n=1 Tax=Photinus pyralis TaxID=7054 RepID=UPI0012671B29|nr:uroporphyrinogen decarboxylase-like [Photinus pyralis]
MSGDGHELTYCDKSIYETHMLTPKNFPILKNNRLLKAARGETPDKLPIWIMRQAGRYLPEFRELRKQHGFFEICQEPYLACNVTLMPIKRFAFDAAIIFSDILVIPQALKMIVEMGDKGPYFPEPLTLDNLSKLDSKDAIARLDYVGKAITLTRHKLEGTVPLFGFSGAPWTLMAFMIEGGGSKTLSKAKRWLYAHKEESHSLLTLLTNVIIDYFVMQVEAGAQILQLFDTSAEYLNKSLYKVYGLPYLKRIRQEVKDKLKQRNLEDVPVVLFAKGASFCLEEQAELGYEILGVDWTVNIESMKRNCNVTYQGNLDPCALYAPKEDLEGYVKDMIAKFGVNRYIVNLGHGIYPDMEIESVKTFIDTVHNIKTH